MNRHDITNEEILECDCGCGMLKAEQFKSDGYTILSYHVPAFYVYQEGWLDRLKVKVGLIWSILMNRQYRLFEIVIESQDDLNRFKAFVAGMENIQSESSENQ